MKRLPEVEKARLLMTEAMHWSVMKWLREKKNVRKVADQANAALDELGDRVKQSWPANIRDAYEGLACGGDRHAPRKTQEQSLNGRTGNGQGAASRCKRVYDEAIRAQEVAEETFDRAERMLSPSLARDGCTKAILSWELKEKAIHLAEDLAKSAEV